MTLATVNGRSVIVVTEDTDKFYSTTLENMYEEEKESEAIWEEEEEEDEGGVFEGA